MSRESEIRAGHMSDGMAFNEKIWALCARVPKGYVTTYGELARAIGSKGYRAVGNAMNKNPYAPGVPCHRVVGSDGKLTGFAGGLPKKVQLLADEGIEVKDQRVDMSRMFKFETKEF